MQFRDLDAQYRHLKAAIDAGIQEVIVSNGFILGKKVTELEDKLAAYVGRKHCIGCANGTDALQLVLMAWGIGVGDAVYLLDLCSDGRLLTFCLVEVFFLKLKEFRRVATRYGKLARHFPGFVHLACIRILLASSAGLCVWRRAPGQT